MQNDLFLSERSHPLRPVSLLGAPFQGSPKFVVFSKQLTIADLFIAPQRRNDRNGHEAITQAQIIL